MVNKAREENSFHGVQGLKDAAEEYLGSEEPLKSSVHKHESDLDQYFPNFNEHQN